MNQIPEVAVDGEENAVSDATENAPATDHIIVKQENRCPDYDFSVASTTHNKAVLIEGIPFYLDTKYIKVWSPTLSSLLDSSVELKDVSADKFHSLLRVMYPTADPVNMVNCAFLLDLSYTYKIAKVMNMCEDYMERLEVLEDAVPMATLLDLFEVTYKHNMEYYPDMLVQFFIAQGNYLNYPASERLSLERSRVSRMSLEAQSYIFKHFLILSEEELPEMPIFRETQVPSIHFKDPNTPHDKTLVVEQTDFYVNSYYLSHWSDYFNVLFNGNFKESGEDCIVIHGVAADDFEKFLNSIYPTEENFTLENCAILLDLAHRFACPGLIHHAANYILRDSGLDFDDAFWNLDIVEIALKHNMEDLEIWLGTNCFQQKLHEHVYGKTTDMVRKRYLESKVNELDRQSDAVKAFILMQSLGKYDKYEFEAINYDK